MIKKENLKKNSLIKPASFWLILITALVAVSWPRVINSLIDALQEADLFSSSLFPSKLSPHSSIDQLSHIVAENRHIQSKIMAKLSSTSLSRQDRFNMSHFRDYFFVEPIDEMVVHDNIKIPYQSYVLQEDPKFIAKKESYQTLSRMYESYFNRKSSEDKRFYVKWSDISKDFSLHAAVGIPMHSVLGFFTGEIRLQREFGGYSWTNPASLRSESGEKVEAFIDSMYKGNWFRFMQTSDRGNTLVKTIPYENQWYILFETIKPVDQNEEILLDNQYFN